MQAPRPRARSRSWIGTLNNYTDEELQQLRDAPCVYMALGFHVGEKSHLPHVHILIQYTNPRVMPRFNRRIHWEPRRGTVTQAINYLNKEQRLEERGDRPRDPQGIDEQWQAFVESIHAGTVDKDSRMYARYEGYARRRLAELAEKKDYDGDLSAKNIWIWGRAGAGKSRLVRQTFAASAIYNKQINKWWDGYQNEPCVLIEDIDPRQCEYLAHHLKVWSDRYTFSAEIKNGRIQINPFYHLVVTSQYDIEECFPGRDGDAIRRRFDVLEL